MEILYKVEWSSSRKFRGNRPEQALAWSRKNTLAFCLGKQEFDGSNTDHEYGEPLKYCIYLLDPNYPWEVFSVDSGYNYPVEHLRWDPSGSHLISCDVHGHCKVWTVGDAVFNKLDLRTEYRFNCRVVCLAWLGVETTQAFDWQSNAKDVVDKFPQRVKRLPLMDIGGQASEGMIFVTFVGQVFVIIFGDEPRCETLQLSGANLSLTCGAIAINENGKISIAIADTDHCVQMFNVILKSVRGKVTLAVENQPCIVPSKLVDDLSLPFEITQVDFPSRGSSETILVCCKNACGSVVKCFDLCRDRISLHPRYQRSVQHLSQLPFVHVWGCSKVMSVSPAIKILETPRLMLTKSDTARGTTHVVSMTAVSEGNRVCRVSLPNLVQLDETSLNLGDGEEVIQTICHSPLDLLCSFLTNKGNFGIIFVKKFNEYDERLSLRIATNLMEFSLVTGLPSWEIAVATSCYSGSFSERCLTCLKDDLTDQKSNQEMMFLELLLLEANFYSVLKNCYVFVFECYNALVFKAIRAYLRSVVDALPSEKDTNLLQRISSVVEKQSEPQISKIAQSVDCSESPEIGKVIAEVQGLLQWIVEYAIHLARLVTTMDFKMGLSHLSCFANGTLLELQEILVLIYIWGQRFPSWQPNVITLGNPLDVLSQVFRLVLKLHSVSQGENVSVGMDDIPLKSLQIMYCDMPMADPSCSILSIQPLNHSLPYNTYEFADQDEITKMSKSGFLDHPLTAGMALSEIKGTLFYDGINCIVLRPRPGEALKQCVKCRLLTLSSSDSGRSLNQTWMERWQKACICGGQWKSLTC